MHLKNTILTAAAVLSTGAAAGFLVITDYPQALQTLSPKQGEEWISSNLPGLESGYLRFATDPSYIAQATAIIPPLREFVATATASIPPAVTALDQFTIFTTVPAWYTDLPAGVKSFYDDAAERVGSLLDQTVSSASGRPANATTGPSVTPTRNVSGTAGISSTLTLSGSSPVTSTGSASPENTGSAGRMEVGLGVGVAAGFAGLLAL